jgi:hypothetical protein
MFWYVTVTQDVICKFFLMDPKFELFEADPNPGVQCL